MAVGGRVVPAETGMGRRLPRVSVVVPCYNYASYVRGAVDSALDQEGVEVDVVVVDDASTDGSAALVAEIASRDPRVRLVRHEQNAGHVETSNEALSLATGEFVVKLDADDLLAPGALQRAASLMAAFPRVTFTYGRPMEFRGEPPALGDQTASTWTVWEGRRWLERLLRRGRNVIMQPEVMVRRTAVEATGGYRPSLRWAEDYNWWLRLAALGDVGRVNGVTQGLYRVHDRSIQRSAADLELSDLRGRVEATDLFFAESAPAAGAADLVLPATRALLRDARRLAARAHDRPEGGETAAAEFQAVAAELRGRLSGFAPAGLSASGGAWGRAYRDIESRLTWRRWSKWGL